jgi:lipopolysaccharide heptosyltransferase II
MRSNPALKTGDSIFGRIAFGLLRTYGAICRRASHREPVLPPDHQVQRILAIKLCCLGDAILAVPALRALKQRWPQARLTVVCTPRSCAAFENLAYVDDIVCIPVTGLSGVGELIANLGTVRRALAKVRKERPNIAVDLDLYFRATPVLACMSGAPVRVGFDTEGFDRAGLFTHSAPRARDRWEAECFMDLLRAIGVDSDDLTLDFPIPPAARQAADQILSAHGIAPGAGFVSMCPGSSKNWPSKQWSTHRFAEIVDFVHQKYRLPTVLIGASFEVDLCDEVAGQASVDVANLAGETSVPETAAILQRSSVLVTNDTGPLHLATAVGTPVVAIFGPTNEKKWGPRGPRDVVITNENCDCRPCYYLSYMPDCEHRRCLAEIPASRVKDAVAGVLG